MISACAILCLSLSLLYVCVCFVFARTHALPATPPIYVIARLLRNVHTPDKADRRSSNSSNRYDRLLLTLLVIFFVSPPHTHTERFNAAAFIVVYRISCPHNFRFSLLPSWAWGFFSPSTLFPGGREKNTFLRILTAAQFKVFLLNFWKPFLQMAAGATLKLESRTERGEVNSIVFSKSRFRTYSNGVVFRPRSRIVVSGKMHVRGIQNWSEKGKEEDDKARAESTSGVHNIGAVGTGRHPQSPTNRLAFVL